MRFFRIMRIFLLIYYGFRCSELFVIEKRNAFTLLNRILKESFLTVTKRETL